MLAAIRQVWPLLLGMMLLQLGNGLQGPLLGLRGGLEQFDPATMGYVMSGYFIGFLGGSVLAPMLMQHVGHVRVYAALGSLISACFILFPVIVDETAWFVLRIIIGFCFSGVYVVSESWLNDMADNKSRGKVLSAYLICQSLGVMAGQMALNLGDPGDYPLFIYMSVAVSLAFMPVLLFPTSSPAFATARPMRLVDLVQASPLGSYGMALMGVMFGAMFGMAGVYGTEAGLSAWQISMFTTAMTFAGMVMQVPIGWLSDWMGRRHLILGCATVGALGSLIGWVLGNWFAGVLVASLLTGAIAFPIYGLLVAHTNDFLSRDQMTAASGGLLFLFGVGSTIGPILTGYVMGAFGPAGYWQVMFASFALTAVYSVYRMTKRPTRPRDELVKVVPLAPKGGVAMMDLATDAMAKKSEVT